MNAKSEIKRRIEQMGEDIANGGAKSFEEYKSMVGERRGMRKALMIMEESGHAGDDVLTDDDDD